MRGLVLISTSIIIFVLILSGCAQMQANSRLQEYKEIFNPLIGVATKEQIVQRMGLPTRKQSVGNVEVWEYHQSFGTRGRAYAYSPYNSGSAFATGSSHEVYDRVTLTFDSNGILQNANFYVQR